MCIILFKKINGKVILAKNRDRKYKPKIQIVHEIRNGVEIAYIRDLNTEWCEGLNQYGVGIINSALEVEYDENPFGNNTNIHTESREKYLDTLAQNTPLQTIDNVFNKNYYADISLQGHNIIGGAKFCLHVESNSKEKPSVKIVSDDTFIVTNHGINLKGGYLSGLPLMSSILRKKIIETEFKNNSIQNVSDVFSLMNKNYSDLHIDHHTYKDNKKNMFTTGQILLNLTDKVFMYNYDIGNSYFYGVVNKLPDTYEPIIKIIVNPTLKNTEKCNLPFPMSEIEEMFRKYSE
jgi:hypothetical protein